jgi:hypothetical protein
MALEAFIKTIFRPENYSANAILVQDVSNGNVLLTLPDGLSRHVRALPASALSLFLTSSLLFFSSLRRLRNGLNHYLILILPTGLNCH